MNKICVYTCITGDYDDLKEVKKEKGIDYYCFTNNKNLKSKTWNIVYIDGELSNVKLARKIKILGHQMINDKYDIKLWMDAAVTFKKDIKEFIDYYMDDNVQFIVFKHGVRDNIKDECFECVKLAKETKENVKKILKFYKDEDFKDDTGLIESTVFIKIGNSKELEKTMKMWFDMIMKYSHRDQLSFNYVISKTDLNIKWIDEKVFDNDWFDWQKHNEKKELKKYRLYFGNEDNFNLDNDIQGEYKIEKDCYKIEKTVPGDTDRLLFSPCHLKVTEIDEVLLNGKVVSMTTLNIDELDGKYYVEDENPFIVFHHKFKKGEKIKIELKMHMLSEDELVKLIDRKNEIIAKHTNTIEKNKNELVELQTNLDAIRNSKSWKIVQKIRKILRRK